MKRYITLAVMLVLGITMMNSLMKSKGMDIVKYGKSLYNDLPEVSTIISLETSNIVPIDNFLNISYPLNNIALIDGDTFKHTHILMSGEGLHTVILNIHFSNEVGDDFTDQEYVVENYWCTHKKNDYETSYVAKVIATREFIGKSLAVEVLVNDKSPQPVVGFNILELESTQDSSANFTFQTTAKYKYIGTIAKCD